MRALLPRPVRLPSTVDPSRRPESTCHAVEAMVAAAEEEPHRVVVVVVVAPPKVRSRERLEGYGPKEEEDIVAARTTTRTRVEVVPDVPNSHHHTPNDSDDCPVE